MSAALGRPVVVDHRGHLVLQRFPVKIPDHADDRERGIAAVYNFADCMLPAHRPHCRLVYDNRFVGIGGEIAREIAAFQKRYLVSVEIMRIRNRHPDAQRLLPLPTFRPGEGVHVDICPGHPG